MSFSLCGLVSTYRGAMVGTSGWSGSTWATEFQSLKRAHSHSDPDQSSVVPQNFGSFNPSSEGRR